jgi:hypothetical protein
VFILSFRGSEGLVETRLGGQTYRGDLDAIGFHSIPSALVFKRRFSKRVHGALGVYVTDFDSYRLNHVINVETPVGGDVSRYYQRATIDHQRQTYHLGLHLGVAASKRVRLGLSLFGVYSTYLYEYRDLSAAHTATATGTIVDPFQWNRDASATSTLFGLQFALGLQWEMVRHWHLGLTLRSPVGELHHANRLSETLAAVDPSGAAVFERTTGVNPGTELVAPAEAVLAIAYNVRRFFLGLEAEVQLPVRNFTRWLDYTPQWNLRVGGRFFLSKKVALGIGAFTDRSLRKGLHFTGDRELDYYGGVLGFKWRKALEIKSKRPENLVLTTTAAVRYAYGYGHLQGYLNDLDGGATGPIKRRHTVHEIALYVGSSLYF